jgi:hypothetical protein
MSAVLPRALQVGLLSQEEASFCNLVPAPLSGKLLGCWKRLGGERVAPFPSLPTWLLLVP